MSHHFMALILKCLFQFLGGLETELSYTMPASQIYFKYLSALLVVIQPLGVIIPDQR